MNSLKILRVLNQIRYKPQIYQLRFGTGFGGSHYFESKLVQGPEAYTDVEKSFQEWKCVEKLLPPEYIPQAPLDPSIEYPSGWKPQNLSSNLEYLIRRTKNFMIPVYLQIGDRGTRRNTRIRRIEGNIWALEKHVGHFLQSKYPDKIIITYAHECCRFINVRGDYVDDIKEWLLQKGF